MADLRKAFGTDKELETKGVDIHYSDIGVRIRIARAGGANKNYERAIERKSRPFKRAIQNNSLSNEQSMAILREVYAETVVLGWEGVELDGEVLQFNKENCIRVFEELPDLFQDIMENAQRMALFKAEILEQEAGN